MPKDILVKNIMTKSVISVSLPGSRDEVLGLLRDKKISGVPVMKNGELIGIVTRSNLLKNPEEDQLALLMTRTPVTITQNKSIVDAAKLLIAQDISRLPVLNKNGKMTGLVTISDIVDSIATLNITEPIKNYLSNEVVSVWDKTPLSVVARIMELSNVKAVPILDSDLELVGIISESDIISASVVQDSIEVSDMSAGSDDDDWTWESYRDTMSLYYSVSKINVPKIPVSEFMIKKPITVSCNSEISECALEMKKSNINQIPVINTEQKLLGLMRSRDFLKVLIKE